jgi:uncharacterized membrane protein YeaQ/YmgE (transglycosylase-associated protein family)
MGIIAYLVVGLIAGWAAGFFMKGSGYGLVGDIILGILGALFGGWLAGAMFGGDFITGINATTIVVSIIGAMILIAISRVLHMRSRA